MMFSADHSPRLLTAALLLATAISAAAADYHWVTTEPSKVPYEVRDGAWRGRGDQQDTAAVGVDASQSSVVLWLPKRETVKVFTILGQPISTDTLDAGVWTFHLDRRGIYIVKIGSVTRRVVI